MPHTITRLSLKWSYSFIYAHRTPKALLDYYYPLLYIYVLLTLLVTGRNYLIYQEHSLRHPSSAHPLFYHT